MKNRIKTGIVLIVLILILISTVLICPFLIHSSFANEYGNFPQFYLVPEVVEIRPNETAVVDIVLVNGSSVGTADLYIEYDNVIEIINVSSKYNFDYHTSIAYNHHIIHFLNVKVFLENETVENSSIIANITLKGVAPGKAILGFSHVSEIYDKNGKLIGAGFMSTTEVVVKSPVKSLNETSNVNFTESKDGYSAYEGIKSEDTSKKSEKVEISLSKDIIKLNALENGNLDIILKNASQIHTLNICLEFNGETAWVQNITSSSFKIVSIDPKGQKLNITLLSAGKLNNDITSVANLTLKALSKGITVISISSVSAYDADGDAVNVSISRGSVEVVVEDTVPEWTGVAVLYFAILVLVVLIVLGTVILSMLKSRE